MGNQFKTQEQRENWNKYNNAYAKVHYKTICLKLNFETDKDIIDCLTKSDKSATQVIRDLVALKKADKENYKEEETASGILSDVQWNNNARAIRKANGVSLTKMAEILGMSKQGLCFSEYGHISRKTAEAIAEYFKVSVVEVLGLDSFQYLPSTDEEREHLIRLLRSIDITKKGLISYEKRKNRRNA